VVEVKLGDKVQLVDGYYGIVGAISCTDRQIIVRKNSLDNSGWRSMDDVLIQDDTEES
jgi:hypothetical protein